LVSTIFLANRSSSSLKSSLTYIQYSSGALQFSNQCVGHGSITHKHKHAHLIQSHTHKTQTHTSKHAQADADNLDGLLLELHKTEHRHTHMQARTGRRRQP
jgi:hypothetical protein